MSFYFHEVCELQGYVYRSSGKTRRTILLRDPKLLTSNYHSTLKAGGFSKKKKKNSHFAAAEANAQLAISVPSLSSLCNNTALVFHERKNHWEILLYV